MNIVRQIFEKISVHEVDKNSNAPKSGICVIFIFSMNFSDFQFVKLSEKIKISGKSSFLASVHILSASKFSRNIDIFVKS